MTSILGISAFYHDSAAALLVDGRVVAAAQEERFSRVKHDSRFPEGAIRYCLNEAGLTAADLDHVAFYEKPLLKFERLLETYQAFAPRGFVPFVRAMPLWLRQKLFVGRAIRNGLGNAYRKRIIWPSHHESHAASAFFPSPFRRAAILTVDGVGEWATATIGRGEGGRLDLISQLRFPHSLGLLYSAFTYYCGFKVDSGEYKLMGLAPYGEPRYAETIRRHLIDLREDGSFRLDLSCFAYTHGLTMTSAKFDRLFGGPRRLPESPVTEREMDLAASIQVVTEEVMLRMARHAHRLTGCDDLCLAGGVALNCVANGRLLREGPFRRIWVQPAAGDAGGALGAAWFVHHQLLKRPRSQGGHESLDAEPFGRDAQHGSLLGPAIDRRTAADELRAAGAVFETIEDPQELCDRAARALADGKVVGWVQGRMEFGPRALGSRSILGDARRPEMQSVMNLKIKYRESFRPFAPVVLRERASDWFDFPADAESPYMLIVAPVAESKRLAIDDQASGMDRLKQLRSQVPAITHVDHSARLQTVDAERHGRLRTLLESFERQTGCPILINTSFNVRGEPIVATAADAYRCFRATEIDLLIVGDHWIERERQAPRSDEERRRHLASFGLD
ncbi:MAG TPA: carbamoyltransferase [Pirellulaceae bacterium]|nr:carbamoyltransferase [Pirellulaceae bacterium]